MVSDNSYLSDNSQFNASTSEHAVVQQPLLASETDNYAVLKNSEQAKLALFHNKFGAQLIDVIVKLGVQLLCLHDGAEHTLGFTLKAGAITMVTKDTRTVFATEDAVLPTKP
jgi:hypothetical protein